MRFVYAGVILNIIGSLILVTIGTPTFFIIGRILQGLSAAAIMPATISLVKVYFQGKDRQRALSYWSIGSWGGSGFCSFFGGALASSFGWRSIFILSIIVSIISLFLLRGTPESMVKQTQKTKFDTLGLILFIVAILALNLFITKGSSFGWSSIKSIVLLLVFVICVGVFCKVESKSEAPFIDFSLFKNINYLAATLSNFFLNSVAGVLIVINSYVQEGRGLSPVASGLLSLGYLVFILLTIRVGEKILQKRGAKFPMILGSIIVIIGIALMNFTFLSGTMYFVLVFIGYSLFGIGLGLYATPSTDTAISSVPDEKAGVASGIYKMASSLGGALGVAISASLYTAISNHTAGANLGLCVNIIFVVVSLIAVILLLEKH